MRDYTKARVGGQAFRARTFSTLAGLTTAFCTMAAGCGDDFAVDDAPTFTFPDDLDAIPNSLRAWGAYPAAPDLDVTPAGFIRYEPRFPLWSNGSSKVRDLVLPPGAVAPDGDDLDEGRFPVGTLFFKTFAFRNDRGEDRLVETRVMLRLASGDWGYASFLWNDDGTDAVRRTLDVATPVAVLGPDGASLEHVVPAGDDCVACHERSRSVVLGYDRLQLGRVDLPAAVRDAGPLAEAVVGYAVGNCVSCHNEETPDSFFDLRPGAFLANTVDQLTTTGRWYHVGTRVVPGDPDQSFLYQTIAVPGFTESVPSMPPLGVQRRDDVALETFRRWIESLSPS